MFPKLCFSALEIPHTSFPVKLQRQFLIRLVASYHIECSDIIRSPLFLHDERAARGGQLTAAQRAFMRQCVAHGYAVWQDDTFALTPEGLVVQNAILEKLI